MGRKKKLPTAQSIHRKNPQKLYFSSAPIILRLIFSSYSTFVRTCQGRIERCDAMERHGVTFLAASRALLVAVTERISRSSHFSVSFFFHQYIFLYLSHSFGTIRLFIKF